MCHFRATHWPYGASLRHFQIINFQWKLEFWRREGHRAIVTLDHDFRSTHPLTRPVETLGRAGFRALSLPPLALRDPIFA
jgi:hypothetical protein